jgi:hypothetical protein
MSWIVDCSVAIAWCFNTHHYDRTPLLALALLSTLGRGLRYLTPLTPDPFELPKRLTPITIANTRT